MMRLRRASGIAALFLVAWVAAAHAECAWVLWSRQWEQDWFINGTHQNKNECVKRLELAAGRPLGQSERASGTATTSGSGSEAWVLLCLPDTVDPRGPKGR
jgi:hypothetical protein